MQGPRAMLAVTLDDADFATVTTPAWPMQKKVDGVRIVTTTGPDGPTFFNRAGQLYTFKIRPAVVSALSDLEDPGVLDGEYANGIYHIFDLPLWRKDCAPTEPWADRNRKLQRLLDRWSPPTDVIRPVPFVVASAAKIDMLAEINEAGGEGVVFKLATSAYTPGESSAWRKMKFVEEVDVVIVDAGHNGKDNFTLALVDPSGPMILPSGTRGREVGHCSAITGDGRRCKIGDVVTVTVAGVGSSGSLVEAVKPRLRHDKGPDECTIDQLDPIRRVHRV